MNTEPSTAKIALISGGMGAVGRSAARALVQEGYRVLLLYRSTSQEDVAEASRDLGGNVDFIRCDITNDEDVAAAINATLSMYGRIDVCIHAAVDRMLRERLADMDPESFRAQFEAGFFGAFNLFRRVTHIMREQKSGLLIGITSSVIEAGATASRMGAYTAAKAALRALLRGFHAELTSYGIRVIAIAPDLMQTPLNADLPEKYFEFAKGKNAGVALMTPNDVAQVIVRACGDDSLSGVSILVSSGAIRPL